MRYFTVLLVFCLTGIEVTNARADKFVVEEALDAAFCVRVNVEVTLGSGRSREKLQTAFSGSSMCVSPQGHLITCKHVADPERVVGQLIAENPRRGAAITKTFIRYTVTNRNGLVFYTDYEPQVKLVSANNSAAFGIEMLKLESRSDFQDSRRHVRIVGGHETADLLMLKLEHTNPLPYVELSDESSAEDRIFAVAARADSRGKVTAARRLALFVNNLSIEVNASTVYVLLMTTIHGDSGSGVVTEEGKVIGMMIANEPPEIGGDTSYMLDLKTIKDLCSQNCVSGPSQQEDILVAPPPPEIPDVP